MYGRHQPSSASLLSSCLESHATAIRRPDGWTPDTAHGTTEAAMSHLNVTTVRCEALFASALQRSQSPTPTQVRQAIMWTVRDLGSQGCAERVAQEFGDHPETAVARMRWARQLVAEAFAPARRDQTRHAYPLAA